MDIHIATTRLKNYKNACEVVPLFAGKKQVSSTNNIDELSLQAITRAKKRGDARTTIGHHVVLHELPNSSCERVLVIGAGEHGKMSAQQYRDYCAQLSNALHNTATQHAVIHLHAEATVADQSAAWHCQQLCIALEVSLYRFTAHKRQNPMPTASLTQCTIIVDKSEKKACLIAQQRGSAIAHGMNTARDLGNLAGNICTPSYLATHAQALAKTHPKLNVQVINEAKMKTLGMGALLAVSSGSKEPAKLICMNYSGAAKSKKPLVLVGKGVTFDTGGISIKPSGAMDEMKFDMCGAASVMGTMAAICELNLNCNVIGVVAAAENMPDGEACRPGDVVSTMSGQTVEILNTDAEGRLVLCDALTYIERFKPAEVIDVATLTGACITALGSVCSGLLSNNQEMANRLIDAGQDCGDYTWQLPLFEQYQQQLDSNFADIANIGGPPAGTITAACFLSRFTQKYCWSHLDIAGIAWKKGAEKGATGRPVPLLMHYILNHHS